MYRVCPECLQKFPPDALQCPTDGTVLLAVQAQDGDPLVGKTVNGRYFVEALVQQGGMGRVYRAIQTSVDRPVALKVMLPDLCASEVAVRRFYDEARILARLASPHVLSIHEYGELQDGTPFLVTEWLDGLPLSALIAAGPLPLHRVRVFVDQVCAALAVAHGLGFVHRDLKPDNLMVTRDVSGGDLVKVLDFGVARRLGTAGSTTLGLAEATLAGTVVGTPAYMSPEQADGDREVTPQSDLYSLSVVVHEMLSGRALFEAATPVGLLMKHLHEPPPSIGTQRPGADIPDGVERFLLANLSKDPARRSPDALAYRQAFGAACGPEHVDAKRETSDRDLTRAQGRTVGSLRHLAAGLILTAVVAVAVFAGMPPPSAHAGNDGLPRAKAAQLPAAEPSCAEPSAPTARVDFHWGVERGLADHLARWPPREPPSTEGPSTVQAMSTVQTTSTVQVTGPAPVGNRLVTKTKRFPVQRMAQDKPPPANLKQTLGLLD